MVRASLYLLLVTAVIGPAAPAFALSITIDSIAVTANNTADSLDTNGASRSEFTSTAALSGPSPGVVPDVIGQSLGFSAVYSFLFALDREANGGSNTLDATMEYEIVFTVDNPSGLTYQLDIGTSLLAGMVLVGDGSGDASATLSAVTGLLDGASDASLATGAPGTLSGANGGYQDVNLSNTLTLVESAVTRQYTLTFSFTGSITSGRDEAAILGGIAGSLGTTTADDYPSVGNRSAASDGHVTGVNLTVIPEPPMTLLMLSPLVALVRLRRKR